MGDDAIFVAAFLRLDARTQNRGLHWYRTTIDNLLSIGREILGSFAVLRRSRANPEWDMGQSPTAISAKVHIQRSSRFAPARFGGEQVIQSGPTRNRWSSCPVRNAVECLVHRYEKGKCGTAGSAREPLAQQPIRSEGNQRTRVCTTCLESPAVLLKGNACVRTTSYAWRLPLLSGSSCAGSTATP